MSALAAAQHPAPQFGEHPGQAIIAADGAMISQVQQTIVNGDLYGLPTTPPPALALLFVRYRAFVAESFGALDFRGVLQFQLATRISLAQIYIPVQACLHRADGRRTAAASIHAFVREQPLLVVLGEPGSGKSTLVRYLLLALTNPDLHQQFGLAPTWLPIFFPVAAYAVARAQPGCAELSPLAYLSDYYRGLSQPDYGLLFQRALEQGHALVLLDGLDEVRDDRRPLVRALESFAREWDAAGNRFIATSRLVGYDEAPLDPHLFGAVTIQPLGDAEILAFIERWSHTYASLGEIPLPPGGDLLYELVREAASSEIQRRAADHVASLRAAVFADPHVTALARTPLLLTILALIHNQGARLPDRRVELYRLCVEALAETWNRARSLSGRPVDVLLGDEQIDERFVVNLLGPVALWIHGERAGGLVEQAALEAHIASTLVQTDGLPKRQARRLAKDFIELMRRDTGLLQERGHRRFAFLHLTFEEYLAARGLLESVTVEAPERLLQSYAADPRWREVVRLAVAAAPQREAQRLLLAILATSAEGEARGRPVVLAGECLLDLGRNSATGRAWEAVVAALLALLDDQSVMPATRIAGGALLGWLGDPRRFDRATGKSEGAADRALMLADYWCSVQAGPGWHGDEHAAPGRAGALQQLDLSQPVRLGRYPVTNAEFAPFVAAGAYADPRWWTAAGWVFITSERRPLASDEPCGPITQPALWSSTQHNGLSQPVVGVSWYEAAAYAAWLTAEGRREGWLYPGEQLRLPTALEWERAARHPDQRRYPWGDERPSSERAAFDGTGLRAPAPVGCFPAGAAACGAHDLAGNVWEWTASLADSRSAQLPCADVAAAAHPVIKGGSFNWDADALRCGAHFWFHPGQRCNLLGFRLVWAAVSDRQEQP